MKRKDKVKPITDFMPNFLDPMGTFGATPMFPDMPLGPWQENPDGL